MGHVLVDAAVDVVDIDADVDEIGGHQVGGAPGVLVHEAPGVGDEPDVERLGDHPGRRHAELAHEFPHDLRGARRAIGDEVDGPEARVVVMVVDVEDVQTLLRAERLRGVASEVAAVEEDERALGEIPGRFGDEVHQRQEGVFLRQREIALGDEHQAVLADRRQDAVHGHQRAQRVAVGVLVGDHHELLGPAQLLEDRAVARPGLVHRDGHASGPPAPSPASSSFISAEIRMPRSVVSSYSKASVGVCLSVSSRARRRCR